MANRLDDEALDTLFRNARTQNKWFNTPVSTKQLVAVYDLMKWGPTSANCFPIRIVFVVTPAAKERLKPLVFEGNRPKVTGAPVTAIVGYDTQFYDWLPRLFPHRDMRSNFVDKPPIRRDHRVPQQQSSGRLLHARGPRVRARLWAHVGIRQRRRGSGILSRGHRQIQLHLRAGARRPVGIVRSLASSRLQRGMQHCIAGSRSRFGKPVIIEHLHDGASLYDRFGYRRCSCVSVFRERRRGTA